jgi:hypothetical protein
MNTTELYSFMADRMNAPTPRAEYTGVHVQEYVVEVDITRYGESETDILGIFETDTRPMGLLRNEAEKLAEKHCGRVVPFGPMREVGE